MRRDVVAELGGRIDQLSEGMGTLRTMVADLAARLPSPVALLLSFADPRLTDPDDSAAVSPISVATRTRVIVKIRFVEGQSGAITDVDFSFDDRTTVTLDPEHTDG